MLPYFGDVWITRLVLQRGMAGIYLIAFLAVAHQFKPLLGERGLLPASEYVRRLNFLEAPSIFCWRYSDRLLDGAAWTGIIAAGCSLCGLTETGPVWLSLGAWLLLWFLYLSIVNVGQVFFAFGWESMLLEAGFFTAFLGPSKVQPSLLPIFILRWMLFRTEMGAGLIKLRYDRCWRDLTCLFYHYETQPLPNPLSWYFHHLPALLHRFSALFSHFVQVVVPFALFAPQPVASAAGALIVFHQCWLVISGNYAWLNWLTIVLGLSACNDRVLALALPVNAPALFPRPLAFNALLYVIAVITAMLSIRPTLNLLSKQQIMNRSYNPFQLVNSYGAFGHVSKDRYEIVLEGTSEHVITPHTLWKEYVFKAKPVVLERRPPQIAPYHLRLDWMIWFLPFSVAVADAGIRVPGHHLWFLRLVRKLLAGDAAILKLMGPNPFGEEPPRFIRALFYQYRYTNAQERRTSGAWWTRRLLGTYLQPASLETLEPF